MRIRDAWSCGYNVFMEKPPAQQALPPQTLLLTDGGAASLLALLLLLSDPVDEAGVILLHVRGGRHGAGSRRRLEAVRRRADLLQTAGVRVLDGPGGPLREGLHEAVRSEASRLVWPTRQLAGLTAAAEAEAGLLSRLSIQRPPPHVSCPLVGMSGPEVVRGVVAAWPAEERTPWSSLVRWCDLGEVEPCGSCGGCQRWAAWASGQAVPGLG